MIAVCLGGLSFQQVRDARASVREEVEASSRVATHLLTRVGWSYRQGGLESLQQFLRELGHVRANEISLFDAQGRQLYASPPPTYKQGREAPQWYTRLVAPEAGPYRISLPEGGTLVLQADPSRAILDGWDDWVALLGVSAAICATLILASLWLTRRAVAPLNDIVHGLQRMQGGDYDFRLPGFAGREAAAIGAAFNRMASAVKESVAAQAEAAQARSDLRDHLAISRLIESRVEEERRSIARELHDELGQSMTAVRSLGLSIARRDEGVDARVRDTAELIAATAAGMYDTVHDMIGRLRPPAIDDFGLVDALRDLVTERQIQHPEVTLIFDTLDDATSATLAALDEEARMAVYRILQEALTNGLRHAQARRIHISLGMHAGTHLVLKVEDDGVGFAPADLAKGHFGVIGMRERARAAGGEFVLERLEPAGTRAQAVIAVKRIPAAGAP